MASKVTLENVAKRAGVHRSTVSLALRDHPRISMQVRKRIQKLAKKMGYRVNPLVAALMQSRRSGRAVRNVVLAYVTNYPTRYGWRPPQYDRPDYFPGAAARARELGYKVEHFWLAEPDMTPERFCDMLTTRRINGVLVGRLPLGQQTVRLLWDRFSCVALGLTLHSPLLHRVTEDFYWNAWQAMDRLIDRGYRRIGFAFAEANDSPFVGERWIGGFLRQQMRLEPDNRIPPLLFEDHEKQAHRFADWFTRWQPDALLVPGGAPALTWLDHLGKRAPRDVGLATLANDHPERGWAGINCAPSKLGALAVEMLVGLMQRGESGVPVNPHTVLLQGKWCEGGTVVRTK